MKEKLNLFLKTIGASFLILIIFGCGTNHDTLTKKRREGKVVIKVASFNVHALPTIDAKDRMKAIAEYIKDYDIIGIQEAWTEKSRELIAEHFPYKAYGNKSRSGLKFGDGLMILSKHPILAAYNTTYEGEAGAEKWWAKKGAMVASIKINGFLLNFYTTHLQAQKGKKQSRIRKSQLAQFLMFIGHLDIPKIVTGDFNIDSATGMVPTVLNMRDIMHSSDHHIDYILYQENSDVTISHQVQHPSNLSDHPLIHGELTLKRK